MSSQSTKPLIANRILLILLMVSIAQFSQPDASAQTFLSGGIEHSDKLEPAPDELKPGKGLEDKKPAMKPAGEWFSLPSWLAGSWRTIQLVRTNQYDDATGASDNKTAILSEREKETFGFQLDKQHNYWTPSTSIEPIKVEVQETKTDSKDAEKRTLYKFRRNEVVSQSGEKLVIKSIDTVVGINPDTRRINEVELRESIRTFILLDSNVLAIYSDIQTYDSTGFPKSRSKTAEFRSKDGDFKVIDQIGSLSLYASFKSFLQKTKQLGLAPEKQQ